MRHRRQPGLTCIEVIALVAGAAIVAAVTLPLLAASCDLMENLSILTLLERYPSWSEPSPQLALRVGPRATLGKWGALTATLALLVRHALTLGMRQGEGRAGR